MELDQDAYDASSVIPSQSGLVYSNETGKFVGCLDLDGWAKFSDRHREFYDQFEGINLDVKFTNIDVNVPLNGTTMLSSTVAIMEKLGESYWNGSDHYDPGNDRWFPFLDRLLEAGADVTGISSALLSGRPVVVKPPKRRPWRNV